MLVFDFEVFKHDWLVCIFDIKSKTMYKIINDAEALAKFYNEHKRSVWIGYNCRGYDKYILQGILAGFNPKQINDWIILEGRQGWAFSNELRRFHAIIYDVKPTGDKGLKQLEGFMGNNIHETSVPFDIDRPLTQYEINLTAVYCEHDVMQTFEVFGHLIDDFKAQLGLIKMFELPFSYMSKTKAQLAATILNANYEVRYDEFDIDLPPTLDLNKYKNVPAWYLNKANYKYRVDPTNPKSKRHQLITRVAAIECAFGWGGVHGGRKKYHGKGYFVNMDVASLYPSLMIEYDLHSRSCDPTKFVDIYERRLRYKAEGNPEQQPLKILLNATYGAMKAEGNGLLDPRQNNRVCVYGQLLLLDLVEKLEPHCEIIQVNTDGVLVKLAKYEDYDLIDDIAHEWEQRTRLVLEFDEYAEVYQKDVNNYLIIDHEGRHKAKGAWLKKLNAIDYDLAVVNRALVDYMVHGTAIEATVMACNDLRDFQMICKASSKFKHLMHGSKVLQERTVRVFASTLSGDSGLGKVSLVGEYSKYEGTPERCFINNDAVKGVGCPKKLNKEWYIDLAKSRLEEFFPKSTLFDTIS